MTLSVLFATINEGIDRIQQVILPPRQDVNYLILHHYTDKIYCKIPIELIREDVVIHQIQGRGVSKARNLSISYANGDIALIADDDITYTNEYFNVIFDTFKLDDPDIALFKIKTLPGEGEYKNYPTLPYQLSVKNLHSVSSIEIAFKLHSVKNKITFDERFGTGSFLIGGEEDIFVLDALKNGLTVKYYPYYVVNHPEESHVKRYPVYDKKRVYVRGAYYARNDGWIAIPKIFIKSLLHLPLLIREHKNPVLYLYQMYIGCFYILLN